MEKKRRNGTLKKYFQFDRWKYELIICPCVLIIINKKRILLWSFSFYIIYYIFSFVHDDSECLHAISMGFVSAARFLPIHIIQAALFFLLLLLLFVVRRGNAIPYVNLRLLWCNHLFEQLRLFMCAEYAKSSIRKMAPGTELTVHPAKNGNNNKNKKEKIWSVPMATAVNHVVIMIYAKGDEWHEKCLWTFAEKKFLASFERKTERLTIGGRRDKKNENNANVLLRRTNAKLHTFTVLFYFFQHSAF